MTVHAITARPDRTQPEFVFEALLSEWRKQQEQIIGEWGSDYEAENQAADVTMRAWREMFSAALARPHSPLEHPADIAPLDPPGRVATGSERESDLAVVHKNAALDERVRALDRVHGASENAVSRPDNEERATCPI
jgi:hypothetical protein